MRLFVVTIPVTVHEVEQIGSATEPLPKSHHGLRIDVRGVDSHAQAAEHVSEHLQDLVDGDYEKREGRSR